MYKHSGKKKAPRMKVRDGRDLCAAEGENRSSRPIFVDAGVRRTQPDRQEPGHLMLNLKLRR